MAKFEQRKTKEVTLPVSGAIVKIYEGLTAGDVDRLANSPQKNGNVSGVLAALLVVADWDFFKDDEGKQKEDITEENIGRLAAKDLYAILKEAKIDTDFLEEAQS
jgi:hypothetical protein